MDQILFIFDLDLLLPLEGDNIEVQQIVGFSI